MVGGLVEIAAACERLWQSQSGMNLDFPSPDTSRTDAGYSLPAAMVNLATRIAAADYLGRPTRIPNPQWDGNLAMGHRGPTIS